MRFFLNLIALILPILLLSHSVHADPPYLRSATRIRLLQSTEPQMFGLQQRLDYDDAKNDRIFTQRGYFSAEYARGTNSPVLYMLGGEATMLAAHINTYKVLAKEIGAYIVMVEHRFYGYSLPSDIAREDLKYLTVRNAVIDAHQFQSVLQKDLKLTGPWIVTGSSYSGSLAAYYHDKYPQATIGALAYSAPVKAKFAFSEFLEDAATILGEQCYAVIKSAVEKRERLSVENPQYIEKVEQFFPAHMRQIPNPLFRVYIINMINMMIQGKIFKHACPQLIASSDALASLGLLAEFFETYAKTTPSVDRNQIQEKTPESTENLNAFGQSEYDAIFWNYQTCSELGYFKTASPISLVSPQDTAESYQKDCEKKYDIKQTDIEGFNKLFYEPLLTSKNAKIMFINGSWDPWRLLSILPGEKVASPYIKTLLVKNAIHGVMPSRPEDKTLDEPTRIVVEQMKEWIKDFKPAQK